MLKMTVIILQYASMEGPPPINHLGFWATQSASSTSSTEALEQRTGAPGLLRQLAVPHVEVADVDAGSLRVGAGHPAGGVLKRVLRLRCAQSAVRNTRARTQLFEASPQIGGELQ